MSVVFQFIEDAIIFLGWALVFVCSAHLLVQSSKRPLAVLASGLVSLAALTITNAVGLELILSLKALQQGGLSERTAWEWGQSAVLLVGALGLLVLLIRRQTRDSFQRIAGVEQLMDQEQERLDSRAQLSKLSQAVEQSADAVTIISTEGLIEYVNPRFVELTGYSRDEVIGREATFLCASQREAERRQGILVDLKKGACWKGEFRNRSKSGELYWAVGTLSPICDEAGQVTHFVSTSEDYTELRKARDTIEQLAFYDPLTDLPNRR